MNYKIPGSCKPGIFLGNYMKKFLILIVLGILLASCTPQKPSMDEPVFIKSFKGISIYSTTVVYNGLYHYVFLQVREPDPDLPPQIEDMKNKLELLKIQLEAEKLSLQESEVRARIRYVDKENR
jgi:hypothetical protein